jgi:imidazolonepropionase-like amidohydrolase
MDSIKVIKARRLIDGTGSEPIEFPVIVINNNKIEQVGTKNDVEIPKKDVVMKLDIKGGTILPGLVDSHLHLALGTKGNYEDMMKESNGVHLLTGVFNTRMALMAGITTVKEAGARDRVAFDLREGWRMGLIKAPRLLISGRPLTVPLGHFHFCNNNEAKGVHEVRKRINQFFLEGVDLIKIMASGGGTKGTQNSLPSYTEEELKVAVEEAHKHGLTTFAHCEAFDSVGNAARAGVDVLEHCGFILPDGTRGFDVEAVETMVSKRLYYNPTLQTGSIRRDALREKKRQNKAMSRLEEETLERLEYKIRRKSENLIRMVEMGVKVVAGSDGIGLGNSTQLIRAMELMVEAGMPPLQVITSATSNAAKAMKMEHLFGTIAEGLEADIIGVNGDPSEDISCLRSIRMIMQDGKVLRAQHL